MMDLHISKKKQHGYTSFVDDTQDILQNIRLGYVQLSAKDIYDIPPDHTTERCIVLLQGAGTVRINEQKPERIGPRQDVFSQKAWAVYLSINDSAVIATESECECIICSVKADRQFQSRIITPNDINEHDRGQELFRRDVFDIIAPDFPAHKIMVGETRNPQGNWSSFPPHKHDCNRGDEEIKLEEAYYFRINPADGFGFQRIYDDEKGFDFPMVVKDHSVVLIPYGYHPVAAIPGYSLYYLWVLAGDKRALIPYEDPTYQWIGKTGTRR